MGRLAECPSNSARSAAPASSRVSKSRQMGLFEPAGNCVALALLELDAQERVQVAEIALVFSLGLLSQTRELTPDPG